MKIIYTLFTILFLCSFTYSAEFVWFNVNGFEGWAENSSETNTNKKKIFVMPRLYGPDVQEFGMNTPDTTKLLVLKSDGSIVVKYQLRRDLNVLPSDFKRDVYKQIHNIENLTPAINNKIANEYEVQFATPKNLQFSLLVGGKILQTIKTSSVTPAIVGAVYTNEFDGIAFDHENYSDIKNGQFKIEVKYLFPYAQFSSIDLNFVQSSHTKILVETFKQVIQQSSTSGGSFFIFDFRKTYVRNIEKERVSSNSSARYRSNLSITIREPDETILKILDEFMGATKLSKEKFIENHRYLTERAFAQNNPTLGNLSKSYVAAVERNDTAGQIDVLKAAAALAQGDVLSFIAAGVRFSDNSSSNNSTYIGGFRATIDSQSTENLSALIIRTADYEFTQLLDRFPSFEYLISQAESQLNFEVFRTVSPFPAQIDSKFLESVRTNNINTATFCLKKGASSNPDTYGGDTPLLLATRNRNLKMVEMLLRVGSDPNLKNRDGEDPMIVAQNDNLTSILALLNQYKDKKGKISLLIKKPAGVTFDNISVSLNNRKSDYIFEPNSGNDLRSNVVPLFATNYLMTISGRVSFSIPREQMNSQIHNAILQNGFTNSPAPWNAISFTYYKTITIYGSLKSVNGVTNEYSYEIVCSNFNCGQPIPTWTQQ